MAQALHPVQSKSVNLKIKNKRHGKHENNGFEGTEVNI